MTRPDLKVEGARELRKALKRVEGGVADLKAVHAEAAKIVETDAKRIVPKRTGRLEGSIRSSGQASQGVVRAGRASLPYAGVIHFGWPAHNISPQPFLYDAVDARHDEVIDTYRDRVNQLIKQHGLD